MRDFCVTATTGELQGLDDARDWGLDNAQGLDDNRGAGGGGGGGVDGCGKFSDSPITICKACSSSQSVSSAGVVTCLPCILAGSE